MVGNTYTYRLVDWMNDLIAIEEAGFDAVALNLGPYVKFIRAIFSDLTKSYSDCWQRKSVALAYQAAAKLNTNLRLFWSFDMNVFPQAGDVEAALIAEYINDVSHLVDWSRLTDGTDSTRPTPIHSSTMDFPLSLPLVVINGAPPLADHFAVGGTMSVRLFRPTCTLFPDSSFPTARLLNKFCPVLRVCSSGTRRGLWTTLLSAAARIS